ncbi:MAG: redoxin domain-containing protein [Anaerolineales bacterium]|nr:redoxin domain-containing protein [Anaerolineales bacterium]
MTLQLNSPVPDFSLKDLDGNIVNINDYRDKIVIINFWSCECPHSERTDKAILSICAKWQDEVELITIASNRNESLSGIKKVAETRTIPQVWLDADCEIANLFEAVTTPHVFVIDRDGILRYQGAVDDVKFRQKVATQFYLDEAVKSLLAGDVPEVQETSAYGCAIVREI